VTLTDKGVFHQYGAEACECAVKTRGAISIVQRQPTLTASPFEVLFTARKPWATIAQAVSVSEGFGPKAEGFGFQGAVRCLEALKLRITEKPPISNLSA